ncbi:hypothetical protein [Paenibacillus flagellatus]|uniref:Uncharacterized protein n=1 Tax=Paenibacillus flagellatus TaxID=2211139 RepID=A0A2V5KNZ4_9BACL|nr:hypothetical protein [Paenibacillus flagellatus]PYI57080.1 hypothetical protein DLM86_01120 [Paenibacillus flagellatus]
MDNVAIDTQSLEIAIQTVLHRYYAELELATKSENSALIQQMAGEITRRARQIQNVTEDTLAVLEEDNDDV